MAAEKDVGGIALGLSLDTTGWSTGIAKAKAELEGLKRSAGNIEIGVSTAVGGRTAAAGGRAAAGPAVVAGIPGTAAGAASVTISPRFQVSAGAVRQLRVEINAQLRALSVGGEAVQVPVKLGRVPFAAMRAEISSGLGQVPINVTPSAASLTAFAAVLSAMTGQTPGKARAAIESAAAARGIPGRAMGGPAWANRPYLVGEKGPEMVVPRGASTIMPMQRGGGVRPPSTVDPDAYIRWAIERDKRMGGSGRIRPLPSEAAMAGRGMVNLAAMRREGMTDPARLKMHREFYDLERRNIEAMARQIGVSGRQLTHVTAALSSNQPWERNVEEAMRAIKAVQSGKRGGFANAEQLQTTAAILSGKPVTGIKRLPFAEAFYDPNAFPIDRWMGRITTLGMRSGTDPSGSRMSLMQALRGKDWTGKDVPTPAERRASVFGIGEMAKQWGISPREAQAEPWGVVRDLSKEAVKHFRLDKKTGLAVPRQKGGWASRLRRLRDRYAVDPDPSSRGTFLHEFGDSPTDYPRAGLHQRVSDMRRLYGEDDPLYSRGRFERWKEGMAGVPPSPAEERFGDPGEIHSTGRMMTERGMLRHLTDPLGAYGPVVDPKRFSRNARGGPVDEGGWTYGGEGKPTLRERMQLDPRYWQMVEEREAVTRQPSLLERLRKRIGRRRGGNAFPLFGGRVDLSDFPRRRRLEVGHHLNELAEEFPLTAGNLGVSAKTDPRFRRMVQAIGKGDRPPLSNAGILYRLSGTAGPSGYGLDQPPAQMMLNASIDDLVEWGQGLSLARTWPDVATHEFGHAIDAMHMWPSTVDPAERARRGVHGAQGRYQTEYQAAALGQHPSPYSMGSDREKFAELFLASRKIHEPAGVVEFFEQISDLERRFMRRQKGGAVFRPTDADTFHRRIGAARMKWYKNAAGQKRRIGETVYQYSPEEYAEMRTFLNASGEAGYAIKPDGDLVSVFNSGEMGAGWGKKIMRSAIQRGATKLDAFDEAGFLPKLYGRFGFRETGRDPWNPDYAPEGWRGQTPDVVYMERRKRAMGGEVDEDLLKGFDHPIYETKGVPSQMMFRSFIAKGARHLMGAGFTAEDAREWMTQEAHGNWPEAGRKHTQLGRPMRPLVLRASGEMVDVGGFGRQRGDAAIIARMHEEVAATSARREGTASPEQLSRLAAAEARQQAQENDARQKWLASLPPSSHSVSPVTGKLPKGLKIRFSPEWSDYPDPSRFLTSGGPQTGLPDWFDKWQGPGQLTMGFGQHTEARGAIGRILGAMEGPSFEPSGAADPHPRRWKSLSEWLQQGKWEGSPVQINARARMAAYLLNEKNKVLGHALVEGGFGVPAYGPNRGKSVPTLVPQYVWTDPSLRGQGLAGEMYARMERFTGMPLMPSSNRTPFGKRLWQKDPWDRRFGRQFRATGPTHEEDVQLRTAAAMKLAGLPAEGTNLVGWRAGSTTDPEMPRDFSGATDPLDRVKRQLKVRGQMRLPGFALGGMTEKIADMGRYIVGEIGRELFVPRRAEGMIPPDVAAQLPGGGSLLERILAGRAPTGTGAGIRNIGGRGSEIWDAPEDGWVIPNRLMDKMGRHAGGDVHQHGTRWQDASGRWISANDPSVRAFRMNRARAQSAATGVPPGGNVGGGGTQTGSGSTGGGSSPAYIAASRASVEIESTLSRILEERARPRRAFDADAERAEARARAEQASRRGLTRMAIVGSMTEWITGGKTRREAAIEADVAKKQLRSMVPIGIRQDPLEYMQTTLQETADITATAAAMTATLNDKVAKEADLKKTLNAQYGQGNVLQQELTVENDKAEKIEKTRQQSLAKQSGGQLQQLATVTAAGVAFTAVMQGLSTVFDIAKTTLSPLADQFTGFTGTATRVTKEMAETLPQAGTIQTLVAQRGMAAGVGAGQLDFLQGRLQGPTEAKAGAMAAAQFGDLIRASMATGRAPAGLIGGYGGLGGGPLFAEQLGGGKGLLETLQQTFNVTRGETPGAGFGGQLEAFFTDLAEMRMNQMSMEPNAQLTPRPRDPAAQRELVTYINEAIGRSELRGGTGGGLRTARRGEAEQVLASSVDEFTKEFAEGGQVFEDAAGKLVTTQLGVDKLMASVARGLTIPDTETFARTQAMAISAQLQASQVRGVRERELIIPGQLGMQIAAQPFLAPGTGLPEGFQPQIADLARIGELQDQINAEGRAGLEGMAQDIRINLGPAQETEFRGYMEQVGAFGREIAGLQTVLADKQAALGAVQYGFALRVINRQIRDARGLAGMPGGSQLGQLQREQYQLNRESQRLQLESQQLANEMAQRQINFQVAIAGFQAPGITGQERAARMEEARVEASFAQRQLGIQVQQTGIAGQQYGVEGQIFAIQTQIAVQDLEAQRGILIQSHALELEQLAVQKQIAALTQRQAIVMGRAQSIFAEASGAFDAQLNAASGFVAQFSGTLAAGIGAVRRALSILGGSNAPATGAQKARTRVHAGGALFDTMGSYDMTVGEAGTETVAVLRNPRQVMGGPPMGGGGGGGTTVNITITGNNISNDMDLEEITRRLTSAIEDKLGRKANLLGVGAA